MCQALPHGRCAADSRPAFIKAKEEFAALRSNPEYANTTDPEKLKEYQTAKFNLMVRRLIYTATPEGLAMSRKKIEEHNGSDAEIAEEKKYYEDALALSQANKANVSRFFGEAAYKTEGSNETFVAMPLSLTNIAQVNDWINEAYSDAPAYKVEQAEKPLDEVEYGQEVETPVEIEEVATEAPVASTTKEKKEKPDLKIFNSREQLHFEQAGKSFSLTEKAYLVRPAGTKEFTLVPASKFESSYKNVVEDKEPQLNNIVLGRVFPSTRMSDYIELQGRKAKAKAKTKK